MNKMKKEDSAGLQSAWITGHAAIATSANQAGVDAVVASQAARVREVYADVDAEAIVAGRTIHKPS